MRLVHIAAALLALIAVPGCHSALISATISNHTAGTISLVEVDYPSASFGVQQLAPGEEYHYRFKVLGDGPTTLLWTEPARPEQKSSGPPLHEGDEGSLTITLNSGKAPAWDLQLTGHRR